MFNKVYIPPFVEVPVIKVTSENVDDVIDCMTKAESGQMNTYDVINKYLEL